MVPSTPLIFVLINCIVANALPQNINNNERFKQLAQSPYFAELFTEFLSQFQQQFGQNSTQHEEHTTSTTSTTEQSIQDITINYRTHLLSNPYLTRQNERTTQRNIIQRFNTNNNINDHNNNVNHIRRRPIILSTTTVTPTTSKPFIFNTRFEKSTTSTPLKSISSGAPSTVTVNTVPSKYDEEIFKKQAENAKYEFASEVDDSISGQLLQREETRNGLAVKGKYSYDDGYFRRTVHYEADDKGYRVVKEESERVGHGPQFNPDGHATVSQYVAGNTVNYQITKDDILGNQKLLFDVENDEAKSDNI